MMASIVNRNERGSASWQESDYLFSATHESHCPSDDKKRGI